MALFVDSTLILAIVCSLVVNSTTLPPFTPPYHTFPSIAELFSPARSSIGYTREICPIRTRRQAKGDEEISYSSSSSTPTCDHSIWFLGSGKTTLLKHILESQQHKKKIAVIVNDMAELNIDSSLVEKSGLVHTKQEIVSMQNGCICCTLRTDLIREVSRLQKLDAFDCLLIESTGISEPMQVV